MKNNFLKNILVLYNYETLRQTKKNYLPIAVSIVNLVILVLNLLIFNYIINFAVKNGFLNFDNINSFFIFNIYVIFLIILFFTPFFLSRSMNFLYNHNIIFNLLSLGVSTYEIVFAKFLRGFFNVSIIILSTFPIIYLSMLYNVYYIFTFLKYIILFYSFLNLLSFLSIYISIKVKDETLSLIYSYLIGVFIFLINCLIIYKVKINFIMIISYLIFSIFISVFIIKRINYIL